MPWTFGPEFAGHPNSVQMRELRALSSIQRAAAFRARMDAFYFKQVEAIASKSPWAPFPLAIMTCIGIETIGAYKYGDAPGDRNGHFKSIVDGLHGGFARVETDPAGRSVTLSTFLYKGFRNSLAHGFYGKWVFITHEPTKAKTFKFVRQERLLVLNVYWFYERFRVIANKYLDELTRATDVAVAPLQTFNENFEKNFSHWL
jgi:hypothetical protein